MASLQASGTIKLSEIRDILFYSGQFNLGNADATWMIVGSRTVSAGSNVRMSLAYSKPVAGSTSFPAGTAAFWTVPAYQFMTFAVRAAGGGGGGGGGTGFYGQYGCISTAAGAPGSNGGGSSAVNLSAPGGGGGNGGYNSGPGGFGFSGGGAGGPGGSGGAFCAAGGQSGGTGGSTTSTLTFRTNGPSFGPNGAYITVGTGGGGGAGNSGGSGGAGGNGSMNVTWS